MDVSRRILSDLTVYMKYARYLPDQRRREAYAEVVERNRAMHLKKFPQLTAEIEWAYAYVHERKVLPSMRSMQFAGKAIELNPVRLYNCSFLPIDDPRAFSEVMFLLLSGTGVGYSVQGHHVARLPVVKQPGKSKRFLVGDSIEGWADAVKVLVNAYFHGKALPRFDFSDVRQKGERLVTSGGKAPGPEPLATCLHHVQQIFERVEPGEALASIQVHDILCHIADAVLSGGIRRSAMIALFDMDDEDMLAAKVGNFYETEPQRQLANNSAVILRHKVKRADFDRLWDRVEKSGAGEPGIFFTNDKDWGLNPCAEVSLRPFQFCNLTTINVGDNPRAMEFCRRARAASFIATLQASYTDFHYLRPEWKRTTEKEALIGVSLTGLASCTLDADALAMGAVVVREVNCVTAEKIGIRPAARCTVVKPEGTASGVVGSASGIHGWHAPFYIRSYRVHKNESIYWHFALHHPALVEDDYFRPESRALIRIPIAAPPDAIMRDESALNLLGRVASIQANWIAPGHVKGANRNNVSVTVSVRPNEWAEVGDWMWAHRDEFTALSVLPYDGGVYVQAPFEDCTEDAYQRRLAHLGEFDLTRVVEIDDETELQQELACAGGQCEIK